MAECEIDLSDEMIVFFVFCILLIEYSVKSVFLFSCCCKQNTDFFLFKARQVAKRGVTRVVLERRRKKNNTPNSSFNLSFKNVA